jgi:hypothetical protein
VGFGCTAKAVGTIFATSAFSKRPICIIALATQRGLGRHKGIALLVIPLRATDDSFGAYHCGCREEALRVARSR